MEQRVSEVEVVTVFIDSPQSEESMDGPQSQEAKDSTLQSQKTLTPQQQELEMLLQCVERRQSRSQDNWSADQIEPKLQTSICSKNNEKPSIYLIGSLPPEFIRKNHFYSSDRDDSKWGYVTFMTKWLGLNVNSYIRYLKQSEDLAWSYYDCQFQNFFNDYKYFDDNVRQFMDKCLLWIQWSAQKQEQKQYFLEYLIAHSCFLVFSIILFQNIRNGQEILNDTRANNISHTDLRSRHFSTLYQEIMKDQIRTKLSMLRLENQIPWFAVEAVFRNSNLSKHFGDTSIERLAISCFDNLYPRANKSKVKGGSFPSRGFKHLLHIFHWTRTPKRKWLVMDTKSKQIQTAKNFLEFYLPNATNLQESATSVKRLDGGSIDVTYSNNRLWALMQITPLHIFSYSDDIFTILLNFEQRYLECGLSVTSYLACMKSLLQTKADVKLLQKSSILQNTLKGEQDILTFVHNMPIVLVENLNDCMPDDLNSLSEKVIKHHEGSVSRAYSEIKSQFFPNKWVIISIIGAIILFVLTIIQTVYNVRRYYKSP
jgi:Plant protein of unknown function